MSEAQPRVHVVCHTSATFTFWQLLEGAYKVVYRLRPTFKTAASSTRCPISDIGPWRSNTAETGSGGPPRDSPRRTMARECCLMRAEVQGPHLCDARKHRRHDMVCICASEDVMVLRVACEQRLTQWSSLHSVYNVGPQVCSTRSCQWDERRFRC